ncbi:MAG TPA: hypothetical protein ENL17_02890 [Candidatus Methanoperedenaceae archaeon]|nr:hypothetical protein [Candidatus Methanoperedenaceae archaeon]
MVKKANEEPGEEIEGTEELGEGIEDFEELEELGGIEEFGELEEFEALSEEETFGEAMFSFERLGTVQANLTQSLIEAPAAVIEAEVTEKLGFENIMGTAIGLKEVGGNLTGEVCVQVMVAEKRGASQVESEAFVPQEVGGIPILQATQVRLL